MLYLIRKNNKNDVLHFAVAAQLSLHFFHPSVERDEAASVRDVIDEQNSVSVCVELIPDLKRNASESIMAQCMNV